MQRLSGIAHPYIPVGARGCPKGQGKGKIAILPPAIPQGNCITCTLFHNQVILILLFHFLLHIFKQKSGIIVSYPLVT